MKEYDRWLSWRLWLLHEVPKDSDMLYINLYDLCQSCLVLLITTFLSPSPWRVPYRGTWQRTSVWALCRAVGTCTWALSQRWLMSELGEKPPEVKGYLLGVQAEIRNSLFMSPFFKMMWDWFSLCLHALHSSPWLKSISSIDFDGFARGEEGDSGSVQPACVLSLSLWDKSVRECLANPPVAGLCDLVLPDVRALLWSGTSGNLWRCLVPIQAAIDCQTWRALCLVLTCRGDKISSVTCKLCLFGFNCGGAAELWQHLFTRVISAASRKKWMNHID